MQNSYPVSSLIFLLLYSSELLLFQNGNQTYLHMQFRRIWHYKTDLAFRWLWWASSVTYSVIQKWRIAFILPGKCLVYQVVNHGCRIDVASDYITNQMSETQGQSFYEVLLDSAYESWSHYIYFETIIWKSLQCPTEETKTHLESFERVPLLSLHAWDSNGHPCQHCTCYYPAAGHMQTLRRTLTIS
jgi:hypothetical protein